MYYCIICCYEVAPPTLGEVTPPTLGEVTPPTLGEVVPPTLGGVSQKLAYSVNCRMDKM